MEFEYAFVQWVARERPSLLQVCAVVLWVRHCRSMGPPKEDAIDSPDPERPEDHIYTIPMANVDVVYLAYEGQVQIR